MMFFRSGFIGYYDLYKDSGTQHFAGQRLGCWVNAIPGNGLVMIPEASAGCVCQFSIASTVVLEPKSESKAWGIFSAVGETTPVKRIGINLGAPGDRRDDGRQDWFGFPRPMTVERLEFVFDIQPRFAEGGGWYSQNADNLNMPGHANPWLFASGARGLEHFQIPLLGAKDAPAAYSVKLFFADMTKEQVAALDIKFQGRDAVGTDQQISSTATSATGTQTQSGPIERKPVSVIVKEFNNVLVESNLVVDLKSPTGAPLSNLTAVEVIRNDSAKTAAGK
ncbi:MAG: hypothetical protein IT423_00695 [Pirellulaceae bacterium]|nr:hypothetical protein [Pirellulaceae bacterium]